MDGWMRGVYRRKRRSSSRRQNNIEAHQRPQLHHHQQIFTITSEVYDELVDLDSKDLNVTTESYDHLYDMPRSACPNPYQDIYEATTSAKTNAAVPNGGGPTPVSNDYQSLGVATVTKNQSSSRNNPLARRSSY